MLYSRSTKGFYLAEIHGDRIPHDAVEISDDVYSALIEGQSQGKVISTNADGIPFLDDAPTPNVADLILAKRRAIEVKRIEEEVKGFAYVFPDGDTDIIQLRDDRDKLNINGQVTAALVLKGMGETGSVLAFQAQSNTTHPMTPDQMIAMGMAVNSYCLGLYMKQWGQKALLDALDPATASEEDVAAVADWPTS